MGNLIGLIAPFARQKATVEAEMPLQIEPFQEAASWTSSRRVPGVSFLRASSR